MLHKAYFLGSIVEKMYENTAIALHSHSIDSLPGIFTYFTGFTFTDLKKKFTKTSTKLRSCRCKVHLKVIENSFVLLYFRRSKKFFGKSSVQTNYQLFRIFDFNWFIRFAWMIVYLLRRAIHYFSRRVYTFFWNKMYSCVLNQYLIFVNGFSCFSYLLSCFHWMNIYNLFLCPLSWQNLTDKK